MSRGLLAGIVAATALVAAAAGCGLGAGPSSEGIATLTVTRDYGAERLTEASDPSPPASETVMRLLDREAEITTRYGGGFVQSIDGLEGATSGANSLDWFFYVNGVESSVGAADAEVRGGDRVWWDYRDWSAAARVPAVVGSFPEPLAQASAGGDRVPVRLECDAAPSTCNAAAARLRSAGVTALSRSGPAEGGAMRVLVGPWSAIRDDPAAAQLERGPATSGVFADLGRSSGRWRIAALDTSGAADRDLGSDAGLVAAVRNGDDPPTWLITGVDSAGVAAAARLLDADELRDHYAVAASAAGPLALPVAAEGQG